MSGLFTSAVIYYKGPISHPKLLNICQWSTQLVAIALIFFSARAMVGSVLLVLFVLLSEYLAFSQKFCFRAPELKFVSREEYEQEKKVATKKELENLRNWLNSDTKRAAYYLNRSKNQDRIKEFMNGSDHITLEEAMEHEKEYGEIESETSECSNQSEMADNFSILTDDSEYN
ncbi:Transmembrane protein 194A [Thelohanellus kitauei]|uniref:Transmembrane protein 194A n=1 Tax=Thelohanellus kitauei TaxID=669202 RepID=A0A0C2N1Y0_THEKT|nr:Transmembrane protein 194A [Thelohanellus kitauei]